jgi:hypothetical protein
MKIIELKYKLEQLAEFNRYFKSFKWETNDMPKRQNSCNFKQFQKYLVLKTISIMNSPKK